MEKLSVVELKKQCKLLNISLTKSDGSSKLKKDLIKSLSSVNQQSSIVGGRKRRSRKQTSRKRSVSRKTSKKRVSRKTSKKRNSRRRRSKVSRRHKGTKKNTSRRRRKSRKQVGGVDNDNTLKKYISMWITNLQYYSDYYRVTRKLHIEHNIDKIISKLNQYISEDTSFDFKTLINEINNEIDTINKYFTPNNKDRNDILFLEYLWINLSILPSYYQTDGTLDLPIDKQKGWNIFWDLEQQQYYYHNPTLLKNPLLPGWRPVWESTRKQYYYMKGEDSRWDPPIDLPVGLTIEWDSKQQQYYYYNPTTKESTWEQPTA